MKKRVFGRKFGRGKDSRRALSRSLVRALVIHGQIKTTKEKARALQPFIDRLVKKAKLETVTGRRTVFGKLGNDKEVAKKFFVEIVPAFKDRQGGYTKIIALKRRRGDGAQVVIFKWSQEIGQEAVERKGKQPVIAKKKKTPTKPLVKRTAKEK